MPELRKDPIIDRWVIIATERGRRPSDYLVEEEPLAGSFSPFSPGNEDRTPAEVFQIGRDAGASPNTGNWRVRVVPNKYPALASEGELDPQGLGMFDLMNGVGAHEVVIENPDHAWDMADATSAEMNDVLTAYVARSKALSEDPRLQFILPFRNKGTAAGATIAHPHSQIIALPILPRQVHEHIEAAREYYERKGRPVYSDIIRQELSMGERIVEANEHFVVLSPFAARFPFELQIIPRRHSHDFTSLTEVELSALGETLARNLKRIKLALNNPAYNLMVHTAPLQRSGAGRQTLQGLENFFQWRIDILPRLTKVAGFEWGTGFYINPTAPESAARFLREVAL